MAKTEVPWHDINESRRSWPDRFKGFTLGGKGLLYASFDNGVHYYELDTAKDVSWSVDWESADATGRSDGCEKVTFNTKRTFSISADVLFDDSAINQYVCQEILRSSVSGETYLVGSFSESGVGPLMWAYSSVDVNEELNGITKLSVKFNPVRFICFFSSKNNINVGNGITYFHPFNKAVEYSYDNPTKTKVLRLSLL